jgi:signal transduction histidine kinase
VTGGSKPERTRRRLFWRIFVHGLLLIVVVTAVSGVVFHLLGDQPMWRRVHERVGQLVERSIVQGAPSQEALAARLEEFVFITDGAIAVYERDGTLLATAGELTPPALDANDARDLEDHEWFRASGRRFVAVALPSRQAYAVFEPPYVGSPEKLVVGLLLLLSVVALMSIPLARAIARPLEKITRTARQLGDGDLAARTGIERRDEVGVLARTMDEMAEQLERKIRAERELLAGASHEIRTPLARIKVALELCNEDRVTLDEIKDQLAGIAGDAAELERLVEDALSVARLDLASGSSDGMKLRRSSTAVSELVERAGSRFAEAYPNRGLTVDIAADLPTIEVDAALVRRLLDNLLDNAAKYSAGDQPIEIAASVSGQHVLLEVRDRGVGVANGDLDLVFEPFFRADDSRSSGGTGLGLTLCKRIALAHGGSITARSRDGGGAIFRVVLPVSLPAHGG